MVTNQPNSLPAFAGAVLDDLRHYLSVVEPVSYQAPLDILSGSTIGQHTRHIIEFYNCLLEQALDVSEPTINYANRRRDHRIESEPDHALSYVELISEKLKELDVDQLCQLDCSEHGMEHLMVNSTIGRELIYNIEHTIHHLAIVKIALRATIPGIVLPEHFGVAPSTIRHRLEACAQ
jgi:predicted transcriptional regulator